MTGMNQCTRWPLNLPMCSYEMEDGERALMRSSMFQRMGLRLLRGAKVRDLTLEDGTGLWVEPGSEAGFDYLVCQGDAVLLAIELTGESGQEEKGLLTLHGIPAVRISLRRFSQGKVGNIVSKVNALQESGTQPQRYCHVLPCPPELTEYLLEQVLLERQSGGALLPTEYGLDFGLLRVVGREGCRAMCSDQMALRLPVLLAEATPCPGEEGELVCLEERIQAYRAGLCSNGLGSVKLVERILNMSLEEYMDGFPQELAQLEDGLDYQGKTYGEAACRIHRMLHGSSDRDFSRAVELMGLLAAPILEDAKIQGAMRAGRRSTGKLPDFLPPRYCRGASPAAGPEDSFQARVAQLHRQMPDTMRFISTPQASFFQGVGTLAGSAYPLWISGDIQGFLDLSPRCSYSELLRTAEYNLQQDTQWNRDLGVRLYYLMLIEPYAMVAAHRGGPRKET